MESPESKGLREDVESLERRLAAARARLADRQQAKAAAANDGDDDAPMPPIQELAVEDAADDAAQPKGSSDDDDVEDELRRAVAQRKGDDTTARRSRPATPLERDEMAADWTKHLQSSQLLEHRQSQLPPEETGQILQLYVARETRVPLDGPNYNDLYASYKNSQARFDADQRRVNYRAALDAADVLRARCDLCAKTLVDTDFDVGDTCFRLGCGRSRCALCQEDHPLEAPSLCQGCPEGIYFPDEAQTVFPPGAPKLFAAWSLEEDFLAELQKESPDPRAVIEFLKRDLDFLSRPTGVHLSDPLFMKALKDRLLSSHRVKRWLGDRLIGTTAWRIRDTIEQSLAARTLPSSRAWSLFVTFYVAQAHQRDLQEPARGGGHVVPGRVREAPQPRRGQLHALQTTFRHLRRGREGGHGAAREARPRRR